jgi:hypothetical protein
MGPVPAHFRRNLSRICGFAALSICCAQSKGFDSRRLAGLDSVVGFSATDFLLARWVSH